MVKHFYIEQIFDGAFDGLNSRIAKLQHFACVSANHVVVLLALMRFFKLSQVLPKLMLSNKIASK